MWGFASVVERRPRRMRFKFLDFAPLNPGYVSFFG
jgi:hypothetical protein